jgi:hypothetical protein
MGNWNTQMVKWTNKKNAQKMAMESMEHARVLD